MVESWLLELAKGIGRFFIHPMVYIVIGLLLLASIQRIKRERRDFGIKVFNIYSEWKGTKGIALLGGLLISVVSIAVGIVVPYAVVLLMTIFFILSSFLLRFNWISLTYTMGFTFLVLYFVPIDAVSFLPSVLSDGLAAFDPTSLPILIGIFLIVEAFLWKKHHNNASFPHYIKGGRGKLIGQHQVKRLGMIPAFMLIPGGLIEAFASWWPLFTFNGESFGLMLIPFVTGYDVKVKGLSPHQAANQIGNYVLLLSFVTLAAAIGGLYIPVLSLISVVIAILGREASVLSVKWQDRARSPLFTPRHNGLPVLGVIPYSTADKMGLIVGEQIEKVNGQAVSNEEEFHQALQRNGAYCKMEIRDASGEIKFAQSAMYQNDHYELGLIFVKDRHKKEQTKGIRVSQ
ncbi:PDZ domain-containing protein [Pontibacillus salicampi]|uniref:PDZ domain-containing protein n=1 Tax=Pontibacillus salicampi TaxID=1449801 RepID=A0ABV6LST0_9BACI